MALLSLSDPVQAAGTPRGNLIARLAKQDREEWRELIAAQLALLVAQFQVWTRPVGRFVEDVQHVAPGVQEPMRRNSKEWNEALRVARAVRRAADHGIVRPKCLVRAVAISRMLEQRGISGGRVRIGVRRVDGKFAAHAWVELGQRLLGDDVRHVRSFSELIDVKVIDKQVTRRSMSA